MEKHNYSRSGSRDSITMTTKDSRRSDDAGSTLEEADFNFRTGDSDGEEDTSTGDKLQLRLLLLEEKERSELMRKQIDAFQDKVSLCFKTFKPEVLLAYIQALASLPNQNEILVSSLHSLARLRMVVQQQLRRASMRTDGTIYFAGNQLASGVARCTQYFVWFFEFVDYLGELHRNFVDRIFLPLFRFFHESTFLSSQGRTVTSGSTFSKFSQFSQDSHDMDDGEHFINDDDNADSDVERARQRLHSKLALALLGKEFAEVKALYDTTEVEKIAQRLSFLKEQLDFMLEEEDEIDPDLFSSDSAKLVQHLDMSEGTENLVRLPVDLLVKFRKAIWLSRQWLDLDDRRTKDLGEKLRKIVALENVLTLHLTSLDRNISSHERELKKHTEDLHRLLQREERCEDLSLSLYNIDNEIRTTKKEVEQLRQQRDRIAARIVKVTKRGDVSLGGEYKRLKLEFERNKLQRFLLERKLATLTYHRQVAEEDKHVEVNVRPSIVRHTNHVQDTCERLEQTLGRRGGSGTTSAALCFPSVRTARSWPTSSPG
ncbi:hypothetical protein C0Q70_09055 [Pomacea canaliculata]|uniref:Uncharacterized protein n=1 Tax=Pomacea canaliculata TaxID=400727 RepID=A0A2T7P8Q6_POMCA|nr:hypothetical protein C0Q70_09055 [Pomacea canaliculata]